MLVQVRTIVARDVHHRAAFLRGPHAVVAAIVGVHSLLNLSDALLDLVSLPRQLVAVRV